MITRANVLKQSFKWQPKGLTRRQKGVGLLEILMALLISSIMLVLITNMYGNFISSAKLQKEQSIAQDQANFAFLALNRAVRMSGAGLCVRPTLKSRLYLHQKETFDSFPQFLQAAGLVTFNANSRLHSFPDSAVNGIPADYTLEPNSDALLVIYSDNNTHRLHEVVDSSGRVLSPQEASPFNARRLSSERQDHDDIVFYTPPNGTGQILPTWVMISDCEHTGIFKYNSLDPSDKRLLPAPEGGFLYNFSGNGQSTLIGRLHAKLFFVATRSSDAGIPHLYEMDLLSPDPAPKPVAAYVRQMKISYLAPTGWISAAQRSNWDDNLPVRIELTMYAGAIGTKDAAKKTQIIAQNGLIYTRLLDVRN